MTDTSSGTSKRGSVLLLSLVLMLFVGALAGSLVVVQLKRSRLKLDFTNKIEAYYGAEGAVEYAMERIWDGFVQSEGGAPGSLTDFRDYLASGSTPPVPAGAWVSTPLTGLQLSPGATAAVDVLRTDGAHYTEMRFRGSVTILGHTENVESAYRAQGEPFEGFKFALLSNNVSCTFCHATFSNVKKYAGGPFPRARVATLESLMVRTTPDSYVYGTLYAVGKLMDRNGNLLNDLSGVTLYGYSMTGGMIDPSTTTQVTLTAAPTDADGNPVPGYNFYKDYPSDPAGQTDGDVPAKFPPVFVDDNLNRLVDDSEFNSLASYANGSASGFGYIVASGSSFGGSSLVTSTPLSTGSTVDGNLILVGTAANPIQINGKVVVNGDVVVKGVVQGSGTIIARGNIYVPGDIIYNDAVVGGVRQYGVAPDGSQNSLGLAAGGNVLAGDYLTPKNGNLLDPASKQTGNSTDGFGFTLSQITLYNRREWQKTQPTLPDSSSVQVPNSTYVAGYIPKYYKIDPSSSVWMYTKNLYWDDAKQSWIGNEHASSFTSLTAVAPAAGAVISLLNPTSTWLTATQVKQFCIEDENQRTSGSPLKVDALLYTDGAVMTIAKSASKMDGKMILNGALVARDTGVLVAKGLEINYDERVTELLNIRDASEVTLTRAFTVRKPPAVAAP